MKKITIYALEGCGACKTVTEELESLVLGTEISISKKFCGATDTACDAIEDGLGSSRYPIIFLYDSAYLKEKFNKVNGIVYICSDHSKLNVPIEFSKDTIAIGVLDKSFLTKKVKEFL
jgi:hypothetical protein